MEALLLDYLTKKIVRFSRMGEKKQELYIVSLPIIYLLFIWQVIYIINILLAKKLAVTKWPVFIYVQLWQKHARRSRILVAC